MAETSLQAQHDWEANNVCLNRQTAIRISFCDADALASL